MYYAIVKNDVIEKSGTLPELFPNTSFAISGPDDNFCADNNLQSVIEFIEHDSVAEKLSYVEPYILDGKVYRVEKKAFSKAEKTANTKAFNAFNQLQGE